MTDPTPADRTLTWWPIVGALVIAAVVAVVIFVVGGGDERPGSKRDDDGALACPSAYDPDGGTRLWVPTDPSGVDGRKALVPDATPSHVTVCSYDAGNGTTLRDVKLAGDRKLTSGLPAMTKSLHALRRAPKSFHARTASGGGTAYLAGLTFTTGYVWVTVPPTGAASNGQFVTRNDLTDSFAAAFRTGTWTS